LAIELSAKKFYLVPLLELVEFLCPIPNRKYNDNKESPTGMAWMAWFLLLMQFRRFQVG